MAFTFSNSQIAQKLHEVSTAYTIKNFNIFQIRAYENVATAVEHLSVEVQDLWKEGRLSEIPAAGETIRSYLDELFKSGKVKHWDDVKKGIPDIVFKLLNVPGIGPKTAEKLAEFGVESLDDLKEKIKTGKLVEKGFSSKLAERILLGINELSSINSGRVLLPYAFSVAEKIINYVKIDKFVKEVNALGSLRRMAATIGDLDFSVATKNLEKTIEHILSWPSISQIIDKGSNKLLVVLNSGFHVDFYLVEPDSYGALLQHFTGSKQHNIHLRTIAEKHNLSISENGVKNVKTGKTIPIQKEEEIYGLFNMQTPSPEIREDTGEIEAAIAHKLPDLVKLKDIKGDLHIHSNFNIEPSHDLGASSLQELIGKAEEVGYGYIGIADHNPSVSRHTNQQFMELIKRRNEYIDKNYSSTTRVLKLLEVDILSNGDLSVPDEALNLLDFAIAGVHSSHRMPKDEMTNRILKALNNPYVKVLSHPTGRLLNERSSYDADWDKIFKFAAENKKALEINSYPNRLDLPDVLVKRAKEYGVKFVIDTDTHSVEHMDNMLFGVAVARRGWLEKEDILNTYDYKRFADWFNIR